MACQVFEQRLFLAEMIWLLRGLESKKNTMDQGARLDESEKFVPQVKTMPVRNITFKGPMSMAFLISNNSSGSFFLLYATLFLLVTMTR